MSNSGSLREVPGHENECASNSSQQLRCICVSSCSQAPNLFARLRFEAAARGKSEEKRRRSLHGGRETRKTRVGRRRVAVSTFDRLLI